MSTLWSVSGVLLGTAFFLSSWEALAAAEEESRQREQAPAVGGGKRTVAVNCQPQVRQVFSLARAHHLLVP